MAEVKVKKELDDADVVEIEYRITALCQQFPHGITDQVIQKDMPHLLTQQRAMVVNRLLKLGQLELQVRKGKPIFVMKDTQTVSKTKGSNLKEKLVYQIVEDAGNRGLTGRVIKLKSNLLLPELNTILKALESKTLIKAVKSGASAKLYMLHDLQPDVSVTRAAFYADQVFVKILGQQCSKFLQSKAEAARDSKQSPMVQRNSSYAMPHAVWKYIRELGISKQEVSMEEIEALLNMLIYDGKVEMTIVAVKEGTEGSVDGQMKLYRAVSPIVQPAGLVRAPCGLCPVFDDCHTGFEISPSTCVYMKEWLDF